METGLLEKQFALMGARLRVGPVRRIGWRFESPGIDIREDGRGEFFELRLSPGERVEYEVADLRRDARHLLLLARRGEAKEKFLCGHDERHWFVCGVPGRSVSGVATALEALQPPLVRRSIHLNLRRSKNRFRRRNEAFVRQGEWFFVPAPRLVVDGRLVALNEPLSRGGGSKPHTCQFAFRTGGFGVLACHKYPQGVSEAAYRRLLAGKPEAGRWNWHRMVRDPQLYVRGRVWHRDHKTVVLDGWHRVVMNTEGEAPGLGRVVFLD